MRVVSLKWRISARWLLRCLREIDDLDPVRVLADRDAFGRSQCAGRGINRVHRHAVRLLARCEQKATGGVDGKTARAFEAKISGETFVLSAEDKILYHGGMTASRGHEGESAGSRGLAEIARRGAASVAESPVFGCSLFKEETLSPGGS